MKTKWRPRQGSTFPRYILRSIHFLKKKSEINVLLPIPRLNFFPEMYSENKFTSPKYIPRGANERKHFQLCCKYFPRVLQKHLIDQEGGGVLKRRKTWNSSTLFTRFWRFWRRPDWDIPPILGADETQYLICGRTPPSEQLAEHYSADCSLTRCTIARLFKSAITHVHSQAAPNCL